MSKVSESRVAYVAGQPEPAESILVAKLDLPAKYAWFNELSAEERLRFFAGLWEVLTTKDLSLPDGRKRSRMAAINEYIRGWRATVEICSTPGLAQEIEAAEKGPFRGPYSSFEEAFSDL